MIKKTPAILNFPNYNEISEVIWNFNTIKTYGSEAKFILSGITLRRIQGVRDGIWNVFLYDSVNRLIGGFPYEIDTKLNDNVIILEEKIND